MEEDKSGNSLKETIKGTILEILENSDIIKTEKIDYIIFGYDLISEKETERKSSDIYMKRILINEKVRNEVKKQLLLNLKHLNNEEVKFIDWGSAADSPKDSVEIADIDIIDKSLRPILLNPNTDSQVIMEELDKWKHVGLLAIINLDDNEAVQNTCNLIIGINSLTRQNIALKKRKGITISGDGVLQYIEKVRVFTLSDLYDAIFICNKLLIMNENHFYRLFVLNEYFNSFFKNNENTINKYIKDTGILYKRISGDIRREKKLISAINNVLDKNPEPSDYEDVYQKYKDKVGKVTFFEHKIDVSQSDINAVLDLLHLDFDEDPMFHSKRRVSPRYGR